MSRFSPLCCADGISRRRPTLAEASQLPPRRCALFDQFRRRRRQCRLVFGMGRAKRLSRRVMTAPLGPASTRSTPASRHQRLPEAHAEVGGTQCPSPVDVPLVLQNARLAYERVTLGNES